MDYDARLALGELLAAADRRPQEADRHLAALEQDARARGFESIARKAAALRRSP